MHIFQGEGQMQKMVLFSNPFPRRSMTLKEASYLHYKNSLLKSEKDFVIGAEDVDKESDVSVNLFECGTFKILVETNVNCRDPSSNETFHVAPKIELQTSIGFEQFSLLDMCRAWWASMIGNTDYILCCRIDVQNDCIARNDRYTRDVLCPPGCPYNPNFYFQHLKHLFEFLFKSECGEYMLEHAAGNEHLFLFKEKETGLTTLQTKYKDLLSKKKDLLTEHASPWLPIDVNIIPNHYLQKKLIPWLFSEPPNANMNPTMSGRKKRKRKTHKRNIDNSRK